VQGRIEIAYHQPRNIHWEWAGAARGHDLEQENGDWGTFLEHIRSAILDLL
jgi:hypothetical protein